MYTYVCIGCEGGRGGTRESTRETKRPGWPIYEAGPRGAALVVQRLSLILWPSAAETVLPTLSTLSHLLHRYVNTSIRGYCVCGGPDACLRPDVWPKFLIRSSLWIRSTHHVQIEDARRFPACQREGTCDPVLGGRGGACPGFHHRAPLIHSFIPSSFRRLRSPPSRRRGPRSALRSVPRPPRSSVPTCPWSSRRLVSR